VDVAPAGGQSRGTEHRCPGQRQHDQSDAKENQLKPHLKEQYVIPLDTNAAFVAAMEDVLEVYHRPHDPDRPVIRLDETSRQLIAETRVPIPAKPGHPIRYDYEYERNGTANLLMMFALLEGWRHVEVTDRHTAVDYAQVRKDLSDTHFPNVAQIVLVQDNLNTHKPASLYEAFSCRRSAPARRTVRVALHAETRKPAGHGGIRTRRPVVTVSRSAHPRQADLDRGSRNLGGRSQGALCQSRLAVHGSRRPHQAENAIPLAMNDSGH
jgi:hypothetical protein